MTKEIPGQLLLRFTPPTAYALEVRDVGDDEVKLMGTPVADVRTYDISHANNNMSQKHEMPYHARLFRVEGQHKIATGKALAADYNSDDQFIMTHSDGAIRIYGKEEIGKDFHPDFKINFDAIPSYPLAEIEKDPHERPREVKIATTNIWHHGR